ncbi:MAG: PQQ-binding-like beta-propeller repeat protein [Planctomycetota bacterium]
MCHTLGHRRGVALLLLCASALLVRATAATEGDNPPAPARARLVLPVAEDAPGELRAARRAADRGQWSIALPRLQALLDEQGRRLLRTESGYRSVSEAVREVLTGLPPEGRRTYATLYGPEARRLYERGMQQRSEAALADVARRFPIAEAASAAAGALAALRMDSGRWAAALRTLRRAAEGRAGDSPAAALGAKEIVCLAHLGRRAEAEDVAARLRRAGLARIAAAGRQYSPEEFVKLTFERISGPESRPARATAFAPDLRYALPALLDVPAVAPPALPSVPSTRPMIRGARAYVKRNGRVFALDLRTGATLWAAGPPGSLTNPFQAAEGGGLTPFFIPSFSLSHWRSYDNHGSAALSGADGRVFAVQLEPAALDFPPKPWLATVEDLTLVNRLRCFDAASGALLWQSGSAPAAELDDTWFFTTPTLSGEFAYVLGAREGELHALCLRADSGRVVWDTRLGAVETRQQLQRYYWQHFLADVAPPGVDDGLSVFPTGRGVLCGLDAARGEFLWAATYPRPETTINRLGHNLTLPTASWVPRRPKLSEDLCVHAPVDGRHVLAFDRRTGRTVWRTRFRRGVALLGLRDGRAYVQTASGLTCLQAAGGEEIWRNDELGPAPGVGALSGPWVYLPSGEGIRRVGAEDGREAEPLFWPLGARAWGNLAVGTEGLAVVGARRASVCPNPRLAEKPEPSAGTQQWRAPLADGAAAAAGGRVDAAVRFFRAALDAAQSAGPAARGAALARMADLALRTGRPALLPSPEGEVPDRAAAAVAEARLRLALRPASDRAAAAAAYLSLCRQWADRRRAGPLADASLWLHLAGVLRRACADDPALERRVRGELRELLRAEDRETVRDAQRWYPFATPAKGEVAPGRSRAAEKLAGVPAGRAAWRVRGRLALPSPDSRALDAGAVLVVGDGHVRSVDADTGRERWSADLPADADPGGFPPPRYVGYDDGLALATAGDRAPSRVFRVDLPGATLSTLRQVAVGASRRGTGKRVDRLELIHRAARDLPLPPAVDWQRTVSLDDLALARSAAFWLQAGRRAVAVNPRDGSILLELEASSREELTGARIGIADGDHWLLLQAPPRLRRYRFPTGADPLAEWHPRSEAFIENVVCADGRTYAADFEGVYRFDLRRFRNPAKWPVEGGVARLLYADAEVVVVAGLDGATVVLGAAGGRSTARLPADGDAPAWAARRDAVLYELRGSGPRGLGVRDEFAVGNAFSMRATDLETGGLLWTHRLAEGPLAMAGRPVRAGKLWLVALSRGGSVRVMGLESGTGRTAFSVELEASAELAPAALTVAGGRLVVGRDGWVAGLASAPPAGEGGD